MYYAIQNEKVIQSWNVYFSHPSADVIKVTEEDHKLLMEKSGKFKIINFTALPEEEIDEAIQTAVNTAISEEQNKMFLDYKNFRTEKIKFLKTVTQTEDIIKSIEDTEKEIQEAEEGKVEFAVSVDSEKIKERILENYNFSIFDIGEYLTPAHEIADIEARLKANKEIYTDLLNIPVEDRTDEDKQKILYLETEGKKLFKRRKDISI